VTRTLLFVALGGPGEAELGYDLVLERLKSGNKGGGEGSREGRRRRPIIEACAVANLEA
jgi:hypothetical protein